MCFISSTNLPSYLRGYPRYRRYRPTGFKGDMLISRLCYAEQLPEWRNFQFAPTNHYGFFFLHTFPSTIAFRLEYVLFYQFYAKITTFFDQEMFGTAPLLYVDVETFGGNWRENDVNTSKWRQNVKIVILTSCTRVVLHPSCETIFPSPGRVHGNPGRVCKKIVTVIVSELHCSSKFCKESCQNMPDNMNIYLFIEPY